MHFTFSESALIDLKKLPKSTTKQLKAKFVYWQKAQDPLALSKRLTKHVAATHRFRAGSYRVLVKVKGQEIRVLCVRDRKDVYKK